MGGGARRVRTEVGSIQSPERYEFPSGPLAYMLSRVVLGFLHAMVIAMTTDLNAGGPEDGDYFVVMPDD